MTASSYRPVLLLALAACAEGAPAADKTVDAAAPPVEMIDAAEPGGDPDGADSDAPPDQVADAAPGEIDAAAPPIIDAAPPMIDAAPPPDAMCTTSQLLANPSFDASPIDTGWVQVKDPESGQRVISDSTQSPRAHSAPGRIWLGNYNGATEAVYQDVAIPAGATALVLTGQVYAGVADGTDHAELEIRRTDDTVITEVKRWALADETSGFTAFSLPITGNHAATTIRVAFKGTTNGSWSSSWMFDTLALNATVCP